MTAAEAPPPLALLNTEPHGLDGLFTRITRVRSSIWASMPARSASQPLSGCGARARVGRRAALAGGWGPARTHVQVVKLAAGAIGLGQRLVERETGPREEDVVARVEQGGDAQLQRPGAAAADDHVLRGDPGA